MKAVRVRALLFVLGLMLIGWGVAPRNAAMVQAAPAMLITETATGEPPTNTPVTPTNTPASQVDPTSTPTSPPPPAVTDTPTATATPAPPPPADAPPGPSATPTITATLAPSPSPAPAPGGPVPDPAVTKSVSPSTVTVGETVVYTILVTNLGDAPAAGVAVDDTLPSFLALMEATATRGTVSTSGQSVRVEIGDLAPGETVEVRVSVRVTAPAAAPNNRNLAVVSSTTPDGNPDNNQASVPVDAAAPPSLPNTSDPTTLPLLATALGLALVAGSLFVRSGARRGPRS